MKKLACVLAMVVAAGLTASYPVLGADKDSAKHDHKHSTTQPATQAAKDAGNTKCLMMPDDDVTDGVTATYKGVTYHFCCKQCIKAFNKDPEKAVKAFEADPAKYGAKK